MFVRLDKQQLLPFVLLQSARRLQGNVKRELVAVPPMSGVRLWWCPASPCGGVPRQCEAAVSTLPYRHVVYMVWCERGPHSAAPPSEAGQWWLREMYSWPYGGDPPDYGRPPYCRVGSNGLLNLCHHEIVVPECRYSLSPVPMKSSLRDARALCGCLLVTTPYGFNPT